MLAPAAANLLWTAESNKSEGEDETSVSFRRYTPGETSSTNDPEAARAGVFAAKISPAPQPSKAPTEPSRKNSRGLGSESSLTAPEIMRPPEVASHKQG
jgi:hypothetical protein